MTRVEELKELYIQLSKNTINIHDFLELYCDICNEKISIPSYHFFDFFDRFNMCEICSDKFWDIFELLDSADESVYGKPCISCDEMQERGKKWYNYKMLNICCECYQQKPQLSTILYYVTKDKEYAIGYRDYLTEITPVIWDIPDIIKDKITIDRAREYVELFDCIVYLDTEFGSYYEWALFTDIYEIPHFDAQTALLININENKTRNGQVASLVCDDHGRVAINIIYNTLDEYLKEYNEWLQMDHDKKIYDELVENDLKTKFECENNDMALACTEFSGYIRNKRELDFYYG